MNLKLLTSTIILLFLTGTSYSQTNSGDTKEPLKITDTKNVLYQKLEKARGVQRAKIIKLLKKNGDSIPVDKSLFKEKMVNSAARPNQMPAREVAPKAIGIAGNN